jgi:hypothetical protein
MRTIGSDIKIIGPRQSGKTTYLATLLYFPHQQLIKYELPELEIIPTSDDARKLRNVAHDILRKGGRFAATYKQEHIQKYPTYALNIEFPETKTSAKTKFELVTKDYPGEIFEDITDPEKEEQTNQYLDDLCQGTGWLIILTDWLPARDTKIYKPALEKLCDELYNRGRKNPELNKLRIAVVMSKCERGEIWPCRRDAEEDLFTVRLPATYEVLIQKIPHRRLKFFACSSFGIMSDNPADFDPRPNRYVPNDGSPPEYSASIRDPNKWQPFGLISPIYWLATGKTLINQQL